MGSGNHVNRRANFIQPEVDGNGELVGRAEQVSEARQKAVAAAMIALEERRAADEAAIIEAEALSAMYFGENSQVGDRRAA